MSDKTQSRNQNHKPFDLRLSPPKRSMEYDALKDKHASYFFEIPIVQKHFKHMRRIYEEQRNPRGFRLSKMIDKVVGMNKSPKRGDSQRHIYVQSYEKDIQRIVRSIDRMKPLLGRGWGRANYSGEVQQEKERKHSKGDRKGNNTQIISQQIIKEQSGHRLPSLQKQRKGEEDIQEIKHSKFISFIRNKYEEIHKRKVYFRGLRRKTQI